jgi:hypothetical protein
MAFAQHPAGLPGVQDGDDSSVMTPDVVRRHVTAVLEVDAIAQPLTTAALLNPEAHPRLRMHMG